MKTLEVSDYNSGTVLDSIYLHPDGTLTYDTDAGRPLIQNLVDQGMTESEAFEQRIGWSNGYVTAKLV
jgi:hypothetical protein